MYDFHKIFCLALSLDGRADAGKVGNQEDWRKSFALSERWMLLRSPALMRCIQGHVDIPGNGIADITAKWIALNASRSPNNHPISTHHSRLLYQWVNGHYCARGYALHYILNASLCSCCPTHYPCIPSHTSPNAPLLVTWHECRAFPFQHGDHHLLPLCPQPTNSITSAL